MDVLSPDQRKLNMSRIRARNTKPEILLRSRLHIAGLRGRPHYVKLVGKPDVAFPRFRTVLFVNGCFWHGHQCPKFVVPGTRTQFWLSKIEANRARDRRVRSLLKTEGWRVITVWECALRGRARRPLDWVVEQCIRFIRGHQRSRNISGNWTCSRPAPRYCRRAAA